MGVQTLALTDINNTSCTWEFISECRKAGIKPVVGLEFRQDNELKFIGLARNDEGFRQLNEWLTRCSLEDLPIPEVAPHMPDTFIIYPRLVRDIRVFRENEFLGIRPEHVNRLFQHNLLQHQDKLIAWCPVTFVDDDGFRLHQLLRAIDLNTTLSKLSTIKGGARGAKRNERLLTPDALKAYYRKYPQLIGNAEHVLSKCRIRMRTGLQLNRQDFTGSKEGDYKLLEKLAISGCVQRYGQDHREALCRTQKELGVIRQQDFCSYFLITWDIVRYARTAGYQHVGRGSGANSIVAYCLHITDVDPLELNLFFERFINPYRSSPPDFDIDFSWDERDDVTDYIFKRYGREHTALLATYSTFKGRSIIRELGKVFGLPKAEIDKIVDFPEHTQAHHDLAKDIFKYGRLMQGLPNHLSIHAGGIVISEQPLAYHTALQLMPKGFPITHFDMYHGEELGFHKFDVLSQRGLGHIKDAVELVKQNQGKAVDIHDVEHIKQDERVIEQLRSGKCMGCFYIESPAMRGLLSKLGCDNYVHLVAASSIIRPGVAQSGMMREYIHRFHHPNSFEYLHPVFEEQLGETFGVMVYQEDVMKIVHHFAGLDLDESDVLRRIMTGKKYKGDTFERLRQRYFDNCMARGYPDKLIGEVWRQIESFSGYSFCKAHSASFAVESFQSLYLKAYYPLEFMVAVINNFGGFYKTEYYFHEARMSGGNIHAPCVNHSRYLTHIERKDIYIGFVHLHGMERTVAHRIVQQRATGGPFRSLADFVSRVDITTEQLEILIRIGAFRFTGKNKYELMWEKNAVFRPGEKPDGTLSLFPEEGLALISENHQSSIINHQSLDSQLPSLAEGEFDQAFDEIELLGFPLRSIFDLLKDPERYQGDEVFIRASDLKKHVGKLVHILGYYVCRKDVRTRQRQLMHFGTWLDRDGQFFDTTHFPDKLKVAPFRGKGIYRITGKVVEDFGFPSIDVVGMNLLPLVPDGRYL